MFPKIIKPKKGKYCSNILTIPPNNLIKHFLRGEFTMANEIFEKLKAAKSAEELVEIAKANGAEITAENA